MQILSSKLWKAYNQDMGVLREQGIWEEWAKFAYNDSMVFGERLVFNLPGFEGEVVMKLSSTGKMLEVSVLGDYQVLTLDFQSEGNLILDGDLKKLKLDDIFCLVVFTSQNGVTSERPVMVLKNCET